MPLPPLTVTVTDSACAVVMLFDEGFTVTVGVVLSVENCCTGPYLVSELFWL